MGLIDTAKEALELVDQVKNVDLYRRLVDLQREAMEFTEQLKNKDEMIKQLKEALALKGKLICKGSVYFIADETGDFIDGPFCTRCFDVDHNKCRIVARGSTNNPAVQCLKCKVTFESWPAIEFLRKQHYSE